MTSWFVDSLCSLLTNSWRWSFPFKRSLYFSEFSQATTKRGVGQYQNHISPFVVFRDFGSHPWIEICLSIYLSIWCQYAIVHWPRHTQTNRNPSFFFPARGCLVFFRCWQAFMASPPWSLPSTNGTRQGESVVNTWGIRLDIYICACITMYQLSELFVLICIYIKCFLVLSCTTRADFLEKEHYKPPSNSLLPGRLLQSDASRKWSVASPGVC